jgi:hypothetical protein
MLNNLCAKKKKKKIYRGLWCDFKRYAANNHPLLTLFFSDLEHPYSRNQRTAEFIGCFMTAFFGAGVMIQVCDVLKKNVLGIFAVTLPTFIFRKIVYVLFTMPCLLHDESATSANKQCCLKGCNSLAEGTAYAFAIAWSLVFFSVGLTYWISYAGKDNCGDGGSVVEQLAYWVYSICQCKT